MGTALGAAMIFLLRGKMSDLLRKLLLGFASGVMIAAWLTPILPYMLAFAAGAMCYVVVEELIPEASSGEHSNLSTIGFAIGFVLMMVLDVVMG
jgi:ZIP family zinc transporter